MPFTMAPAPSPAPQPPPRPGPPRSARPRPVLFPGHARGSDIPGDQGGAHG